MRRHVGQLVLDGLILSDRFPESGAALGIVDSLFKRGARKSQAAGGDVLEGPSPAPNGDRLIARHPDGSVFEYIETAEAALPS